MEEKLKLLRGYINLLKNDKNISTGSHGFEIIYFIIIHNFLLVERMFQSEVTQCNKEINSNLNIKKLNTVDEVKELFTELYDPYHNVRFGIETLDSIESVRIYLSEHRDIYNTLM